VLAQFTIEAVILSTVGGLFGILLELGHAGGDCLTPLQAVISPVAIVVAVVVSGAIGLGFGVVPAAVLPALTPSLP